MYGHIVVTCMHACRLAMAPRFKHGALLKQENIHRMPPCFRSARASLSHMADRLCETTAIHGSRYTRQVHTYGKQGDTYIHTYIHTYTHIHIARHKSSRASLSIHSHDGEESGFMNRSGIARHMLKGPKESSGGARRGDNGAAAPRPAMAPMRSAQRCCCRAVE
jgi:hypothetical protein